MKNLLWMYIWLCRFVRDEYCKNVIQLSPLEVGVATSAYQIEGAHHQGGKGLNIWDDFSHEPNRILHSDTGDRACNEYELYAEDIQHMYDMNIHTYRFSISWSRLLPNGNLSVVNPNGIDYYHRVLTELENKNITPVVTMFHWDLPSGLQNDYGGWENPNILTDFVEYANLLFQEYGSRVRYWITMNEPYTYVDQGYVQGRFAPGKTVDCDSTLPYLVAHHMILAHTFTYGLFQKRYALTYPETKIGITLNSDYPLSEDPEVIERALIFRIGWFLDPLIHGSYAVEMVERVAERLPTFSKKEVLNVSSLSVLLESPNQPYDFIGINHYSVFAVHSEPNTEPCFSKDAEIGYDAVNIALRGYNTWQYYYPQGMSLLLEWIWERYGTQCRQVMITENGFSMNYPDMDDTNRILYLKNYFMNVFDNKERLNITHYFIWSLLDNFEWASGYTEKYGLIHVDFETLKRTWKKSAYWVQNLLVRNT